MISRDEFPLFKDAIYQRNDTVDGLGSWYWIKDDEGTWTGPAKDWEESHKELYFKHLKKHDVAVCAGANQGMYARFYASKFKEVYAFEPNPLSFYVLNLNVPEPNVFKFNCALSMDSDRLKLDGQVKNSGMWRVKEEEEGGILFPCLHLDCLKLWALDFLQLDVEGHEALVIEGALYSIRTYRPVIAAENSLNNPRFTGLMQELDYEVVDQSVSDTIWAPK